jgi:hypothetical protein
MPFLSFASPFVLTALLTLPAIWWWLRVTPPPPQRIPFPPLRLLLDLVPQQPKAAHTPWWLLLLRLMIAASLILAASGPLLQREEIPASGTGPLLLLFDNSFAAAPDWRERQALAETFARTAARDGQAIMLLALADPPEKPHPSGLDETLRRIRALAPRATQAGRMSHWPVLETLLATTPPSRLVWIGDGLEGEGGKAFLQNLDSARHSASQGSFPVLWYRPENPDILALRSYRNETSGMEVSLVRSQHVGVHSGELRALDPRGLVLGELPFTFAPGQQDLKRLFDVPLDIRNAIARIAMSDMPHAGAVLLLDSRSQRRRVGIIDAGNPDAAQPLLSSSFYLARALKPYAELREARGANREAIAKLINEQVSVLLLADIGTLEPEAVILLDDFLEKGGIVIRFANEKLAANEEGSGEEFVPVRLRRGARSVGGALSWETPKRLAPFSPQSPFQDIVLPSDVTVQRQILAEPEATLAGSVWASLEDGTPLVTAARRKQGWLVLFHVTADPSWSNIPLSGLWPDMLRVLVSLSIAQGRNRMALDEPLAPRLILDGYGSLVPPPANIRPLPVPFPTLASPEHPAGFYGSPEIGLALNVLDKENRLIVQEPGPLSAQIRSLSRLPGVDLRALFLLMALLLFFIDSVVMLHFAGYGFARRSFIGRGFIGRGTVKPVFLILCAAHFLFTGSAQAQGKQALPTPRIEAALVTRLAFIRTGNGELDRVSHAGLLGLSQALAMRTALEPGEPIGIDPLHDELAFFPLLYWPISSETPPLAREALRRLEAYMKNGGTLLIDTRDAASQNPGDPPPQETRLLRDMLRGLDIPALEPLPSDHVLTKTFYILTTLSGRYDSATVWVEAAPLHEKNGSNRPARAGDNVSPFILTGNDLAAAWAVDAYGEPLYPLARDTPRQRELALRSGINIVLYALTGNYKADQVHVPALLERLGQ